MADDKTEYFFHAEGEKPRVIAGRPGATLREILVEAAIIKAGEEETLIFVGECEEALKEPIEVDDGVDGHAPVDVSLTPALLGLLHHGHVHRHRCRHVAIGVNYDGGTKRHRFSPAATVEVATRWARHKFRIDPAIAHEFVLQFCNSTTQPRSDERLGELAKYPACSLCFDLVKEETPKG